MYTLWGDSQHACALAKVFVIARPGLPPFCASISQACLAGCPSCDFPFYVSVI